MILTLQAVCVNSSVQTIILVSLTCIKLTFRLREEENKMYKLRILFPII
jgi:hypothetical protein